MILRRTSRHLFLGALLGCGGVALLSSNAAAQTQQRFSLDQFDPAVAGDRFFGVEGGGQGGHTAPRVMLLGEYAYRPLVLYRNDGDDTVGPVVSDQLFAHLGVSLGLWDRLTLSLNLPFALISTGDSPAVDGLSFASPSGAALGDLRLGARLRLLGDTGGPAELSLAGSLWLPTGSEDAFAGDGGVRGLPSLVFAGMAGNFVYGARAGVALRPERQFAATKLGTQVTFGAAAGVLVADRKVQVGPEVYGTTTTSDLFERDTTNLEAIVGAKYLADDWQVGAAVGPGITRGLGTPTLRAVVAVTWTPSVEKRQEAAPGDKDGDGIFDQDDACVDEPGIASSRAERNGCPDRDNDGVFDKDDACVDVAGVATEDPKTNGCPPDKDGDGVPDAVDACPDVPGVPTEDPKTNGCPADKDGDGVPDAEDACVDVPGQRTTDPATNGCPGDTDGDGIRDDKDACPREKGKPNADPEKNGCPELVRVIKGEIAILQQVQFRTNSDVILPASDDLLTQVAAVLGEHPEITEIEVQGHTDNRGNAAYNKALSKRRAASVVRWLVTRGKIDASRLKAEGYGMDQPIADNDSDEGRQKNRRVQFKIVKTSQPTNVQE